ncbi:uncharacterized protein LOC144347426, partial [Saccoglossus kowalevskii]
TEPTEAPRPPRPDIIPTLPDHIDTEISDEITYEIIEGVSQRSSKILFDSLGFRYTIKSGARKNGNLWRCCIRNKAMVCKATVEQIGDVFTRSMTNHIHPAEPGIKTKIQVTKKVHQKAKENIFQSAPAIIEEVMLAELRPEDPASSRPNPSNLARSSNYQRQKERPAEPTDLDFELDVNWIPADFFRKDIVVEGARHLFFATVLQLQLLAAATSIFLDGTFKVIREPFYQLFSIHAFLGDHNGDNVKQVPVAFFFMSR